MSELQNRVDTDPTPNGELAGHVEVITIPLDNLPPLEEPSEVGDFWHKGSLRPDGEGPSWSAIPAAEFGVSIHGDEAVLSVPDRERMNALIDELNPGGLRLVRGHPIAPAFFYLTFLTEGSYPDSDLSDYHYETFPDSYREFLNERLERRAEEDGTEPQLLPELRRASNANEHARADHGAGLLALPASEAGKLKSLASGLLYYGDDGLNASVTGGIDWLLERMSDYALMPYKGTELQEEYKAYLRNEVVGLQNWLTEQLVQESEIAGGIPVDEAAEQQKLKKLESKGLVLELDFEAIDKQVQKVQAAKPPDPVRSLGAAATSVTQEGVS